MAAYVIGEDYFFGVWAPDKLGHFLYLPGGSRTHRTPAGFPFGRYEILDGGLLAAAEHQPEGEAVFLYINGWTVISFWDRTGDRRGGSNSTFLALGTMPFDAMCRQARDRFPTVWGRFTFEVRVKTYP